MLWAVLPLLKVINTVPVNVLAETLTISREPASCRSMPEGAARSPIHTHP